MILYEPPIPVEGVPITSSGVIERLQALLDAGDREGVVMTFTAPAAFVRAVVAFLTEAE